MKLPYLLVLLLALDLAAASPKSSKSQTSKRELVEGNHGDRNQKRELQEGNYADQTYKRQVLTKHATAPGIEYAEDLKEKIPELPSAPAFGARWPQISKISDLLSGEGTPFEVAVANHLHSPVSVYQTKLPSPSSFGLPNLIPVSFPRDFFNPKTRSKPNELSEDEVKKLQEYSTPLENSAAAQFQNENIEIPTAQKPIFNAEANYREPIKQEFQRPEQNSLNNLPPYFPQRQPFFPIYENQGPLRHPSQFLPTHFLQQQSAVQLVPVRTNAQYQEENQKNHESIIQDLREGLKTESSATAQKEQKSLKPGYHAHPNGAVSFASFTQNVPTFNQQSNNLEQQYDQTQQIQQRPQDQFSSPFNAPPEYQSAQKDLQYPPRPEQYSQQIQDYHPDITHGFEQKQNVQPEVPSQINDFLAQYSVHTRPKHMTALQKQLLISSLQSLQNLQNVPLKSFPQVNSFSPETPESFTGFQPLQESKQFNFISQSSGRNSKQISPLPEVTYDALSGKSILHSKPSYQYSYPKFLPTTLPPSSSTSSKSESAPDQLVSSTTVQPDVSSHSHEIKVKPLEQESSSSNHQAREPTSTPLTVQPIIRSTTLSHDTESQQSSTPKPQLGTSPDHEVYVQKQEFQEYHSEIKPHEPLYQPQQSLSESKKTKPISYEQNGNKISPKQYDKPIISQQEQYEKQTQTTPEQFVRQQLATHPQVEHEHFLPTEPNSQATQEHKQSEAEINNNGRPLTHFQYNLESLQNEDHKHKQPQEPLELKFVPVVSTESPFFGPSLPPPQPGIPHFYVEPQGLLVNPDYQNLPGPTAAPSEVQFFGKYASSLFSNYRQ